ncbi:MAG: DUF3021 domain-containing protein [Clostridia bacterium]|nr:DUF3021 domain-containing protein [Clostridia bacterium]
MKKVLKRIAFGILIGCFIFVARLFIDFAFAGGANAYVGQITGEELLWNAIYSIIIALGFSVPSLIYEERNLSYGFEVIITMAIGTLVFIITAFFAGWFKIGIGSVVIGALINIGIAAIVLAILRLVYKLQANKINRKIREKQDD